MSRVAPPIDRQQVEVAGIWVGLREAPRAEIGQGSAKIRQARTHPASDDFWPHIARLNLKTHAPSRIDGPIPTPKLLGSDTVLVRSLLSRHNFLTPSCSPRMR